jgi:hypothetical protein
MITEKRVLVVTVMPPRKNLLNGVTEVDVLVVVGALRLKRGRNFKKDRSRVGVFNPAGQMGMHHGKPPFLQNGLNL